MASGRKLGKEAGARTPRLGKVAGARTTSDPPRLLDPPLQEILLDRRTS